MLVLSRRVNEKIIIDDRITVIILNSEGKEVKIGIEAPKEISVHREEVYKKIKANKEKSSFSILNVQ